MNIFKCIKKLFECNHNWEHLWDVPSLGEKNCRLFGNTHTYVCRKCGKYKEEYVPYNRN